MKRIEGAQPADGDSPPGTYVFEDGPAENPADSDTASTAPPCASYLSPGWRRKGTDPIFPQVLAQ